MLKRQHTKLLYSLNRRAWDLDGIYEVIEGTQYLEIASPINEGASYAID
jgi:hypothetical protein